MSSLQTDQRIVLSEHLNSMFIDTLGREIEIDTRDGIKYNGILAATSNLEIGVKQVHRVEAGKLLPHKDKVIEKMLFGKDEYVCLSVVLQEEKPHVKGFVTDREYHVRNGPAVNSTDVDELEPWDGDESADFEDGIKTESLNDAGRGWDVHDMFHTNEALGVESTYAENLSQYTNAHVEEDSEARMRADQVARQIEQDQTSKVHSMLENDDEERDLDKQTAEYQMQNRRRNPPPNRPSYGSNPKSGITGGTGSGRGGAQGGRRNENVMNPGRGGKRERQPDSERINTRERFADSAGRGKGGSYGPGSNTSRLFTNSALSHGGKGSGGSISGAGYMGSGRYQPSVERPSAQSVHNEFNQFEMRRSGGDGSAASAGSAPKTFPGRRSDQSDSGPNTTKVFEASHRTMRHSANSPHNRSSGDDSRGAPHRDGPAAHGADGRSQPNTLVRAPSSSSTSGSGKVRHSERVKDDLRTFQKDFDNSFQMPSQSHASADDTQGSGGAGTSSSTTPSASVVSKPANAWTKGPPSSIRAPAAQPSQQSGSVTKEPTPAESVALPAVREAAQTSQKAREVISSAQPSPASTVSASHTAPSASAPSTAAVTSTVCTTESPLRMSSTESSSSPSSQSASSALASSVQQMTVSSHPAAETPVLSANGSSSSIAPVDPQPSANVSVSSSTGSTATLQQGGKKFEFNPDAAPFTPRSVITNTPTPRSTPAPSAAPTAVHHSTVHPMSMTQTQGISVAQGIQPGMITHFAPSSFNPNSAGLYSPLPTVYYPAQPTMLPMGTQLAQVSASSAAASVAGGPIVTGGSANMAMSRAGQVGGNAPGARRAQPLISGGTPVYIPSGPFGPQMIPQYPALNVYAASSFQPIPMGSASIPPPSIPPPVSSAVAVAPQQMQILQPQSQHAQAAYSRQYYQSGQGYLVTAPAPRAYASQHQNMDYNGTQQPSSAASSNGNGSNGHNSQPATPGPQPIASPAQVAYPSATNTPQPHPILMPVQAGAPHHPQHMYVQPPQAQIPFLSNTQYMVYNPQQMMQFSAVPSAGQMGIGQASQPVPMEHYQSVNDTHGTSQHNSNNQSHGSIPSQQYMNTEQAYGQYVHGGN